MTQNLLASEGPGVRRLISRDELEAWLRELVWWREWVKEIDAGDFTPTYLPDGRPIPPDDPGAVERIKRKVSLLNAWVGHMQGNGSFTGEPPKLPRELAQLIQFRYMAKTATMGLTISEVSNIMGISWRTFHHYRNRAMDLLAMAVYVSGVPVDPPFSDCQDSVVPDHVKAERDAASPGRSRRRGPALRTSD